MTRVILFDLGGVLVDLDWDSCVRTFREVLHFDAIEDLLDPYHPHGIYQELESGRMSPDEFRSAVINGSSATGLQPRDVDRCLWSFLHGVRPEKIRLLKDLRAEGYRTMALSNNNPIALEGMERCFRRQGASMYELFERMFISSEMGLMKPSSEFYRKMLSEVGCPAEELLFVDDSVRNVEAALAEGIPSVHYPTTTDPATCSRSSLEEIVRGSIIQ